MQPVTQPTIRFRRLTEPSHRDSLWTLECSGSTELWNFSAAAFIGPGTMKRVPPRIPAGSSPTHSKIRCILPETLQKPSSPPESPSDCGIAMHVLALVSACSPLLALLPSRCHRSGVIAAADQRPVDSGLCGRRIDEAGHCVPRSSASRCCCLLHQSRIPVNGDGRKKRNAGVPDAELRGTLK